MGSFMVRVKRKNKDSKISFSLIFANIIYMEQNLVEKK
jgi:hypothetical protein